ncbi:hypothetical protein TNCV_2259461 [Trichonephila clavipes]|nr:hypothetical protein TNCV_2259461 [Trichonephila clavipes]
MGIISTCSSNLPRPKNEAFLEHLATGEEKWVMYKHMLEKDIFLQRGDTNIHIQIRCTSEEGYVVLFVRHKGLVPYELLKENETAVTFRKLIF